MSGPYTITAEAWYDDKTLSQALGLKSGSIERARRSGELRSTRRGGKTLYLGEWVESWLTREAESGSPTPEVSLAGPPPERH